MHTTYRLWKRYHAVSREILDSLEGGDLDAVCEGFEERKELQEAIGESEGTAKEARDILPLLREIGELDLRIESFLRAEMERLGKDLAGVQKARELAGSYGYGGGSRPAVIDRRD